MAKIIPFPGHNGNPKTPSQQQSSHLQKPVPAADSRILPFSAAHILDDEVTRIAMAQAGIDASLFTGKDVPEWAVDVHYSMWWRLGAVLVHELAMGDLPLDPKSNFPVAIQDVLLQVWNPGADADFTGDAESETLRVMDMLESRSIIRVNKKRLSLPEGSRGLEEQLWALWAELFEYNQSDSPWTTPYHKNLGTAIQSIVPKSLGLIRAATEFEAVDKTQLLELAKFNLDLDSTLETFDIRIPRSEAAFASNGRPGIVEQTWLDLVVQKFALPMGLVTIDEGDRIRATPLLGKL